MAIAVDDKLTGLGNEIISDGEKVDSRGTQHIRKNHEVEKSRNNVGEEEESLGSHYERVRIDVEGKLSSDISVDRWMPANHHTRTSQLHVLDRSHKSS